MEFCIDAAQLRSALADIEAAEKNGFQHCLAVFKFTHAGYMLDECRATYNDLLERAHPTDGRLNWGRFQRVSARHRFEDGKLVPIPDGVMVDAPSATQAALRYRVKGALDGKWHYEDHPELMRRVIATREEGEGGGYLYEVEPLAVIPSGTSRPD